MRKLSHTTRPDGKRAKGNAASDQNPLDQLYEDHMYERQVCAMIDRLATDTQQADDDIRVAMAFLRCRLPLHMRNEDAALFPMLRQRSEPEDDIERALSRLEQDHSNIEHNTPAVLKLLEEIVASQARPSSRACADLMAYTAAARRHLILENAIILPLARLRLAPEDCAALSAAFRRQHDAQISAGGCDAA